MTAPVSASRLKTSTAPEVNAAVYTLAPSDETALIQQVHITAAHAICHLVERELFGAPKG